MKQSRIEIGDDGGGRASDDVCISVDLTFVIVGVAILSCTFGVGNLIFITSVGRVSTSRTTVTAVGIRLVERHSVVVRCNRRECEQWAVT